MLKLMLVGCCFSARHLLTCICILYMAAPLHAETPAQQMLSVIQDIFAGESPSMSRLVAVQQALQRSQDVYRPANKDLQTQLRAASDIDVSSPFSVAHAAHADHQCFHAAHSTLYYLSCLLSA